MKRIDTLIHTPQWEEVRTVLETLGVPVTLREVKTFGRTPPRREVYRGTAYFSDVTSELELTAIVEEAQVEGTVMALQAVLQGGDIVVSAVIGEIRHGKPTQGPGALQTAPKRAPRAPAPTMRVAVARV